MTNASHHAPYVAAYIRVSSRAQNLATQRSAISQALQASDGDVVWFEEKRSAKTMDRPELQRLLAEVRAGRVRKAYVFKLDRLTRTGVADTWGVVQELRDGGCALQSVSDGLPLIVPGEQLPLAAKIVLTVLALAAEIELSVKNDRISAARERVAAEGGTWGRPPRMTQDQRGEAVRMALNGRSVREIAVALRTPKATVARALKAAGVRYSQVPGAGRARFLAPSQKDGAPETAGRPS